MIEQSNDGVEQLRQELAALDSSIADLRVEADRLRASAQARSALALLERSATPAEPPVWEDSAPVFAPGYVPQHIDDGLSVENGDAELTVDINPEEVTDTPGATLPQTGVEADAEPDGAAETQEAGATVLEFPGPSDAVSQEVAGFFAESLRRADEADEQSPLANVDQDVEAAFDKFFSADVEPEPAQRWLLSE